MSESRSKPLTAVDVLAMSVLLSGNSAAHPADRSKADKWAQAALDAEDLAVSPPVSGRQLANLARAYLELREEAAKTARELERILTRVDSAFEEVTGG